MVDAVETDPFGKVDAIDVLDLASLEARAEKILAVANLAISAKALTMVTPCAATPPLLQMYKCSRACSKEWRSRIKVRPLWEQNWRHRC